jgi:hypothetical protein
MPCIAIDPDQPAFHFDTEEVVRIPFDKDLATLHVRSGMHPDVAVDYNPTPRHSRADPLNPARGALYNDLIRSLSLNAEEVTKLVGLIPQRYWQGLYLPLTPLYEHVR